MKAIRITNAVKTLLKPMLATADKILPESGINSFELINILTSTFSSFTANVLKMSNIPKEKEIDFIEKVICHFSFQLYEALISKEYRGKFIKKSF